MIFELKKKYTFFTVIITIVIIITVYGFPLFVEMTDSVHVEVENGLDKSPVSLSKKTIITPNNLSQITQKLLAAGLNQQPVLDDTGVSGHLLRLDQGKINIQQLEQYASNLNYLKKYTSKFNVKIPSSFWDVHTKAMKSHHWTEYEIVHRLTQDKWKSYLHLLTQSYARFLKFKSLEASGNDTALDAALDMVAYVEDYYHSVPFSDLIEHAKAIKGEDEAVLMIWQSLVAGTSRINPLTKKAMFSHSIFSRLNVSTMHQYDQGEMMSIGNVWGVSGFAEHFVGIAKNNNQIEHMSISIILQMVMHEPVLILNGIEEEKILLEHSETEMGNADMALNNAISTEFSPYFSDNRLKAVERLRRFLKN